MTDRFRTELEAATELEEAALWYDQQRPGLGSEFLEAVDIALGLIAQWPHLGGLVSDVPPDLPARRVPLGRFPYHIVYLETAEAIRILAFAHDRRRPGYWQFRA